MIQDLFRKDDLISIPTLIGVSGSTGKTITSHLLHHILHSAGKKTGYITTNGTLFEGSKTEDSVNKISRSTLRKTLNDMFHKGAEFVILEVTVDNIKKGIYKGLTFDSEIVTNIMGDISYGTWDSYAKYILTFINQLKSEGILILNADEEDTRVWLSHNSDRIVPNIYVYWASSGNVHNRKFSLEETQLSIGGVASLRTNLLGHFNAINIYQASKLALHYIEIEEVVKALESFKPPKGRLDKVQTFPYTVLIDYGNDAKHVHDALTFLKAAKSPQAKLISVVGPKGNRKEIDYHIGGIATDLSDTVIITSNDPVKEDPLTINQKTVNHAFERGGNLVHAFNSSNDVASFNPLTVLEDMLHVAKHAFTPLLSFNHNDFKGRLEAIQYAFHAANPGDVIYISGKGHENSIHYKDIEYEWSDYEASRIALESLKEKKGLK